MTTPMQRAEIEIYQPYREHRALATKSQGERIAHAGELLALHASGKALPAPNVFETVLFPDATTAVRIAEAKRTMRRGTSRFRPWRAPPDIRRL